MAMSACGGVAPASRFLRRRAAAEDMGAADVDAFWAAAPRLYDFSQQHQPQQPKEESARPPSPPPEQKPRLPALQQRPPSPSPSPSPSRSPSPEPCSPSLLLALQRSCVGWGGARRRVDYPGRHRPAEGTAARRGDGDEDEESFSGGDGGARKRKWLEEVGRVGAASGREDKPVVAKAGKARSRRRAARSGGRSRHRGAARRSKKAPRVVKEEEQEAAAAEESSEDVKPAVVKVSTTEKATTSPGGRTRAAAKRAKKAPLKDEEDDDDEEQESKPAAPAPAPAPARTPAPEPAPASPSGKVDRWAARRYAAAEGALLDVLRRRGATAGRPALRADLRAEARRYIGDTGLLDHLLRHVADKVPAGSADRVRRRFNSAGGLEYWLEPAGLAAQRREAGVDDPYWVPPPGWKLGDPVSPEACSLAVKKQVAELTGELTVVKRQMEQLNSNLVQVSKEAYVAWKGYDCMLKANGKLETEVLSLEEKYENATQVNDELKEVLLLLKEKYDTVLEKNDKLEEQMVALSTSFQSIKDDLLLQKIEQQPMLMLEQGDTCVKEPWEDDKQEASTGNAAVGAGNQMADEQAVDGSTSSYGGDRSCGKWASRKCNMLICRRDGTLQWPKAESGGAACNPRELPEPLTPGGDLVVTGFDAVINSLAPESMEEYLVADSLLTPTSASSTNASFLNLPLLPAPASPVQVQPLPLPLAIVSRDDDLQMVQPFSGGLDLQLRHMDTPPPPPSSGPCGVKALKLDVGNVGTELALATPSY